jgi:hypothetical protein
VLRSVLVALLLVYVALVAVGRLYHHYHTVSQVLLLLLPMMTNAAAGGVGSRHRWHRSGDLVDCDGVVAASPLPCGRGPAACTSSYASGMFVHPSLTLRDPMQDTWPVEDILRVEYRATLEAKSNKAKTT